MAVAMKILTVVGARPQFIKASTVSRAIKAQDGIEEVMVHTGQHYDAGMSDIFFEELDITPPKYHLGIGGGSHGAMTGRMLEQIEDVLSKERPDWVLVYGDTNSTLAGALAAAKMHIPVAHVEAGLRSFNKKMPEEVNRILTDHVSHLLFCPTTLAAHNLEKENVTDGVHIVGDVMLDAALYFADKAQTSSDILAKHGLVAKQYALATIHRAENTDSPELLSNIFSAIADLSRTLPVVLPLHPRTRKKLSDMGIDVKAGDALHLIEPVGYLDMVMLERNAALVATDSGGVQKEAFFYKVPCVTFRRETEWTELVEAGWNVLVDPGSQELANVLKSRIASQGKQDFAPYGDGTAAAKIISLILGDSRHD